MTATSAAMRLLVIDDEPDLRTLYELTLLREGHHVDCASTVQEALQSLQERTFDLVITDMRLPDGTGLDVLRYLEQQRREDKVMVITAYGSAESAVEALRAGAYDYLTKPVDLKQFRQAVAAALASPARTMSEGSPSGHVPLDVSSTHATLGAAGSANSKALSKLVGVSSPMVQVRAMVAKVARSMAPVRLWGESGTGKELVAKAIHEVSPRHRGPFVAVNCGAIPEHLLEAEFFGYRKGAFTGAQEDRAGFFQAAQGGTLFLDEIGDLPLSMQAKLLRVIQERAVRPLGAVAEQPCDVRILSASHKDLGQEVSAGRFRQDLFYRLNVILITLPPLRERRSDLPHIATQLLERIALESALPQVPVLSDTALQALMAHPFPGNVRELENMLHRAVALGNDSELRPEDLGLTGDCSSAPPPEAASATAEWADTEQQATQQQAGITWAEQPAHDSALPHNLAQYLDGLERDIIVRALQQHRLNRTAAGASLGLSLRQMRYRMGRLGINVTSDGVELGAPTIAATPDAPDDEVPA